MFSIKDIESGLIFEKCTIQEISDVERKLRQDIEKKKEDLRQMVGERYRELIEAADTITDMKNGTEKVASSITNLQELCQNLKQSSLNFHKLSLSNASKVPSSLPRNQLNKFNQAVCMKLLMDIPNKIWSSLDREEYLNATRLYLLAQHLHTCLRSGLNEYTSKLINVIIRQWTTVSYLHTTIIKGVEAKLMNAKLSEKTTAECLCSIVLLREISVEEVFLQFLRSREELIKQQLDSCGVDVMVKPLLCDVTSAIITTLRQVDDVFVEKKDGGGLLISKLQHVLACDNSDFFGQNGFSLSEAAMKYLPAHVFDFKPSLKVPLKPVDKSFMTKHCSEFINSSSGHVHRGVESLLSFVTTVRALLGIRDAIYLLVKENLETCNWQSLCTEIVGREFDIWDQLLREHFLERLKVMLQDQMDSLLSSTKVNVSKTLEDFADLSKKVLMPERNLSSYVWSEAAGDVPQNAVWTPINQRVANRDGGLHMKAKGHTPGVQSLCQSIDNKVKILLEDVMGYINPPLFQNVEAVSRAGHDSSSTTSVVSSSSGFLPSIFSSWRGTSPSPNHSSPTLEDSFADRAQVQDLLRTTCISFLNNLLEFLKLKLHAYQEEVQSIDSTNSNISIILQRALYLGRISCGLCDLSPSLQRCMVQDGEQTMDVSMPTSKTWKSLKPTASQTFQNKKWFDIVEKLEGFSQDVHVIWSDHVMATLLAEFKDNLLHRKGDTYSAFISSCTQWDSTVIEEENEEGNIVKSTIKVPMQASWFVQDLLYKLCMHINNIGGHVISGSTISNLAKKLLSNILSVYEELLSSSSPSIHQSRALQLWFDVKYLVGVLSSSAKDELRTAGLDKMSAEVLETLESHVDPFDLDVFRPHIKKHLTRLLQRSSILYGLVLTSERSSFSSMLPSTSGQEQHHIVPLSTGLNRFPLLPLPQQTNKLSMDGSTTKLSQKALQSVGSGQGNKTFNTASSALPPQSSAPQKEQSPAPPPRAGSSSFLEQMSTLFSSSSATSLYIK